MKTTLRKCIVLVNLLIFPFIINGQTGSTLTGVPYNLSNVAGNSGNLKSHSTSTLFEENKGQITGSDAGKVKYTYSDRSLSVFLLQSGLSYQFTRVHYPKGYIPLDKFEKPEEAKRRELLEKKIRTETYRMNVELVNASPDAKIITEGKSNDYINYYNHNVLDVHSYSKITYQNVYPNIDWVIYKSGDQIKYDFVVRAGGDPGHIKLHTSYTENLKVEQDGSLTLGNRLGSIKEKAPVSFQGVNQIATKFIVQNNDISFDVGDYDPSQTLIIDPTLEWATYYGGSNLEISYACSVDGSGAVFAAGYSSSTLNIASNGFQNSYGGGTLDAFLVKFNSSGVRQWATYYGGAGEDVWQSCATDNSGTVYLCGYTTSTSNITSGGFQNTYGGGTRDGFLVKFNAAGLRIWATYYGGSDWDGATACSLNNTGEIYIAGNTNSANNIASGGFQNTLIGQANAFLAKFDGSGTRLWATYYGGSGGGTEGFSCAVDPLGSIYMCGFTTAFNGIASGGHQNTKMGYLNAYLVKFNNAGMREWGTYYGSDEVYSFSCAADGSGNIYLSGFSELAAGIASGGFQNTPGGDMDAFLAKFNSAGVRQWGTFYGGSSYDRAHACATDASGAVYLTGYTGSSNNIASGGYQNTNLGINSFLVKFDSSGARQWGTYYGGNGSLDVGSACATFGANSVYISGYTNLGNLPVLGAHQPSSGGMLDAFLAKFNEDCAPVTIIQQPLPSAVCSGDTAIFVVNGINGAQFQWQVNTGSGFTNITNNLSYSGANNDTLYIYGIPAAFNNNSYQCILTAGIGCPAITSASAVLTVNPSTLPTFSGLPDSICAGDAVPLLSPTSSNGITGYWSPVTIDNTTSGVYTFVPNIVAGQCLATYVLDVTVSNGIVPAFNIDTLICPGEVAPVLPTMSLNNIGGTWFPSIVSNTASATYMFTPASGECAIAVTLNVVIGSPSYSIDTKIVCASDTPFHWNGIPNAGTGAVYTTANAQGCDSIVSLQLTILPPPLIANYDTSACGPLWYNGILYDEGTTVIDTFTNSLGCDSLIRRAHITIYPNAPTVRTIDTVGCDKVLFEGNTYFNEATLVDTFQNSLGCDSLIRKVNVIVDHFELDLDVIPEDPYKGEIVTLEASANSGQFSVSSWSPIEWFPDQEKLTYQLLAEEDARIVISGINEHGCIDTAFVTYRVKPLDYGIFIPNAFSPNGDGVNDHFGPVFYMERAYVIKSFKIFNRWGQIVYSASSKVNAIWNGNQSNGQPSDMGTYSYFIEIEFIDKKVLPLKGDIILVR